MSSERKRKPPRRSGADRSHRTGAEREQHVAAFKKRTLRPRAAGLANEARPGLGTRADEKDRRRKEGAPLRPLRAKAPKAARTYREPTPPPQEEPGDRLVQEQERSTGMSGQSAGT